VRARALTPGGGARGGSYSGADLYALCADAWGRAAARLVARREAAGAGAAGAGGGGEGGGARVEVGQADLLAAQRGVAPSVAPDAVARYEALRAQYAAPQG